MFESALPKSSRFSSPFRILAILLSFCFFSEIVACDIVRLKSTDAFAQEETPANLLLPSDAFLSPSLKAIRIDPNSPFDIDFIIDGADRNEVSQQEANKLVQYFLAALTTPEQDMWVNLSPYESKRIIASQFGETSAGRELLNQDQMLKQLSASLTYPESEIGKAFWSRIYQKAISLYGTTAIPIDTFQRVWIMPQKAVVYEYNGTAFVTESHLKVLLEDDYLALKNAQSKEESQLSLSKNEAKQFNNFSATVTREIILPEIEKEINEGKNFAALRQVFHAIILATWFKKKLKEHILSRVYVDRKKVQGIEDDSGQTADKIYQEYVRILQEGVYNYVRGDFDAPSQTIISRQYFSGGFSIGNINEWLEIRPISRMLISSREFLMQLGRRLFLAKIKLRPLGAAGALSLAVSSASASALPSDAISASLPPPTSLSPLISQPNPGSVMNAKAYDLKGTELMLYYLDKFANMLLKNDRATTLVFISGAAGVVDTDEILKKAGAINFPVYLVKESEIYKIDKNGTIGEKASSEVVLQGGLVIAIADQKKIRYFDSEKVAEKTGVGSKEQLAAYLVKDHVLVAGGPDKESAKAAGGPDKNDKGGIDMQTEKLLDIRGQSQTSQAKVSDPSVVLQNMTGMDFEILELTPINNLPMFIPQFTNMSVSR